MERIKTAFERNAKALALEPSRGRATGSSKIRIRSGLVCDIEEGPWRLTATRPTRTVLTFTCFGARRCAPARSA
jgi:hypothetical protein